MQFSFTKRYTPSHLFAHFWQTPHFPSKKVLHLPAVALLYLHINCTCSLYSLCQLPWSLIIDWGEYFTALNKNYSAVRMLKNDMAAGGDRVMEILKHRSILLAEWMYNWLNVWRLHLFDNWKWAVTVLLMIIKGKDNKDKCKNYRKLWV